jgi:hypothetical protein
MKIKMELQGSKYGIKVDKSNATEKFPIRELVFPLDSGLNSELVVEQYFSGRSLRSWEKVALMNNYPKRFYDKINKSFEDED